MIYICWMIRRATKQIAARLQNSKLNKYLETIMNQWKILDPVTGYWRNQIVLYLQSCR